MTGLEPPNSNAAKISALNMVPPTHRHDELWWEHVESVMQSGMGWRMREPSFKIRHQSDGIVVTSCEMQRKIERWTGGKENVVKLSTFAILAVLAIGIGAAEIQLRNGQQIAAFVQSLAE